MLISAMLILRCKGVLSTDVARYCFFFFAFLLKHRHSAIFVIRELVQLEYEDPMLL